MGERHFNVRKAQLLTGAAVGSSALATGAVAAYAFGDPSAPLFGVENVFWVLMSCTTAGEDCRPPRGMGSLLEDTLRIN
jgi:hypothetical protein